MERLLLRLSVNVTSMFRDPGFFLALRDKVMPHLRTYPFVRIWHAGCSTGEEVYSMAILLQEEGLYDRCRIYATDINEVGLQRARDGIFPLDAHAGVHGQLSARRRTRLVSPTTTRRTTATRSSARRCARTSSSRSTTSSPTAASTSST